MSGGSGRSGEAGWSGDGARPSGVGEFASFGAIEDATADGAFRSITSYEGDTPLATLVPFKRPVVLVEVAADAPVRLSRFAYLHRSGHRMLLKTPLTDVDLEVHDPRVGAIVTALAFDASAASLAARVGLSLDAAVMVVRQLVSMSAANVVGPSELPVAGGGLDPKAPREAGSMPLGASAPRMAPAAYSNPAVLALTGVLGAPVTGTEAATGETTAAEAAHVTFEVATPAHLATASGVLSRHGVPASVVARLPLLAPAARQPGAVRLVVAPAGDGIADTIGFELRRGGSGQDAVPGVLDALGLSSAEVDGDAWLSFAPDGTASVAPSAAGGGAASAAPRGFGGGAASVAPIGGTADTAGAHTGRTAEHAGRTAEDLEVPSTWEFHDLLFHSQSRQGRVRHKIGGTARFSVIPDTVHQPLPPAPGDLPLPVLDVAAAVTSDRPFGEVLRARVSSRDWSGPAIPLAQLSELLQRVAEVLQRTADVGGLEFDYTGAPYPSGGAVYETDIVVLANRVDGLERGAFLYQRLSRSLTPLTGDPAKFDALFASAAESCGQGLREPQALLVLAARFPDLAVKYEGIAYALMLKHVGVLMATIAYTATAMGLGTAPLGTGNSDEFAAATGLDYYRHGSIGEITLSTLPGGTAQE